VLPSSEAVASTTRFSLFVDAGNIFSSDTTPFFDPVTGEPQNFEFSASNLRYSAGFSAQWLAPLGLFKFSYGFPLNDESGDRLERFQFSIGSAF